MGPIAPSSKLIMGPILLTVITLKLKYLVKYPCISCLIFKKCSLTFRNQHLKMAPINSNYLSLSLSLSLSIYIPNKYLLSISNHTLKL